MNSGNFKRVLAYIKANWLLILLLAVLLSISFGAPRVIAWITVFSLFVGFLIKGMRKKRDG
jgi:hypothetical protein